MAAVLGGDIGLFFHHSSAGGSNLIHKARQEIAAATPRACHGQEAGQGHLRKPHHPRTTAAGNGPRGLIEAPTLGMVAPVLEGTGDASLSDAVGHVPASVWPGRRGTSVFAAHNVTWFSHIGSLGRGDEIRYVLPCRTYIYRVTRHRIVEAGYGIYRTSSRRIVLDTCYPLNALYLTGSRYLVYATLTRTVRVAAPPRRLARPQRITVPVPPKLASQGLRLDQNSAPVGLLRLAGSPSRAWQQTSAPIRAETAALTAYFGAIHSASQKRPSWWAALAPSVRERAPRGLWGGEITGYGSHLDIELQVRGDRVAGAALTAVVNTAGSARPGTYHLSVTETVIEPSTLLITGFTMRRG